MGYVSVATPLLALAALLLLACDRNVERYDPAEEPRPPDLARLFPPGADRAAEQSAGAAQPAPQRGAAPVAAGGSPVRGTLRLAPELEGRVPPGATLFLIARTGQAGPPLAVKLISNPSFPLEFEIGPDDRMMQQVPFAGPMQLSARLDADGSATTRQPGDLTGAASGTVEAGDTGVVITIDGVL